MPRETIAQTTNEYGEDTHPAFGLIKVARWSSTHGATLFDSEIKHPYTIVVSVSRASRKRRLQRDWIRPTEELVEVQMSEAQWASFVSSMNTGNGVPCTLRRTENDVQVADLDYTPRLALSMQETHDAAHQAFADIRKAFDAYKVKRTAQGLRDLEITISNAVPNVDFASKSLVEHIENTVQKARADVEAMVTDHARQLGIESSGGFTAPFELDGRTDHDHNL